MNKKEQELKKLVKRYNVLACPKRGVPILPENSWRRSFLKICDTLNIRSL